MKPRSKTLRELDEQIRSLEQDPPLNRALRAMFKAQGIPTQIRLALTHPEVRMRTVNPLAERAAVLDTANPVEVVCQSFDGFEVAASMLLTEPDSGAYSHMRERLARLASEARYEPERYGNPTLSPWEALRPGGYFDSACCLILVTEERTRMLRARINVLEDRAYEATFPDPPTVWIIREDGTLEDKWGLPRGWKQPVPKTSENVPETQTSTTPTSTGQISDRPQRRGASRVCGRQCRLFGLSASVGSLTGRWSTSTARVLGSGCQQSLM